MNRWATQTLTIPPPQGTESSTGPGQINSSPITKLKNISSELQSNSHNLGGVECWTCLFERGWGKETNSQWTKPGKVTNVESGDGAISQLPRVAQLALSRGEARHKGWEWVWGNKPTSQSRAGVDPWAGLMRLRAGLKTELSHLAGGGANQTEF
jgi:hypothetical protein